MTRLTHAIIIRVPPRSLKIDDKKLKIDMELVRKQQEDLCETLREAGLDVIELAPEENAVANSLYADDAAIVINGTALISQFDQIILSYQYFQRDPKNKAQEIAALLQDLAWQVIEAPTSEHGKQVILEGSDVLYTGKEIFVGIRKNGTNVEGALVVGRTFADLAVIPVHINGNLPLKHYISLAAPDVLAVGSGKEAQEVLKRIELEATYRYKTLTIEHEEAINCMNVNGHLIFRQDTPETKFQLLHQDPVELWGVAAGELVKLGGQLSQYCLLIKKIKNLKNVWQ